MAGSGRSTLLYQGLPLYTIVSQFSPVYTSMLFRHILIFFEVKAYHEPPPRMYSFLESSSLAAIFILQIDAL
jgi:hypothetical protein